MFENYAGRIVDNKNCRNHIGCIMAAITLKSLPTTLHRTLKARAARHKRSLNQEVIAVLEEAVAPSRRVDVEATLAATRQFRDSLKFKASPAEIEAFKREGRA
jgi:plasmid stability protein